jgi:hypothetical protein
MMKTLINKAPVSLHISQSNGLHTLIGESLTNSTYPLAQHK